MGNAPALPLTIAEAEAQGWYAMNDGVCDTSLGIRYAQNSDQVTEDAPLTLYYTASGLISGSAMDVYGEGAAPQKLIDAGFWQPVKNTTQQWTISVSFRNSSNLCSASYSSDEVLGDQLVINQGSIAFSVPLTAAEAYCMNWFPGSCMVTMGQHWFYDIETSPEPSWQSDNLLPIVAMYYPPDETGTLSTFFFTTPTEQPGSSLRSNPGDWEPAISASEMCFNFCDDETCHWDVPTWNTLHMYVNSQWSYISCPDGEFPLDRYCPTPFTETC